MRHHDALHRNASLQALKSEPDQASVVVFLRLSLLLLEGIEVVGDSEPEHTALVEADVGQVKYSVGGTDFPFICVEHICKEQ